MNKKILFGIYVVCFFISLSVQAKQDDPYEENDTIDHPYVGLPSGIALSDHFGLGIQQDEDWYEIDLPIDFIRVKIDCTFIDDDGDIDIDLCNAEGTRLIYSASSLSNNEHIDYEVSEAGTYYIRVYNHFDTATGNSYDLRWDALPTGEDDYEPNNSLGAAYTNLTEGIWLSSISGFGLQCDDDWYQINVTDDGSRKVEIECTFTNFQGDIDIVLYNSDEEYLVRAQTSTDNEQIDYVVPATGLYYVKVCFGDLGNAYDLRWNTFAYTPPTLSSLVISGSALVTEGDSAYYTCTATYSDTNSFDVTDQAIWSENSPYASIDSNGLFIAADVSSDQSVSITAAFGGQIATNIITIVYVPPTLSSLSIVGASNIFETTTESYRCLASYSDSSTNDVTDLATWSKVDINNYYFSISSSGVLIADFVGNQDMTVAIKAAYSGQYTTKSVTIKPKISYAEWTILEEIPFNQIADDAAPANDGIPNRLKYACGLPAMVSCSTSDLMSIDQGGAGGTFAIRYRESKSADLEELKAVTKASLSDLSWTINGVTDSLISQDSEYKFKKASISVGSKGFMCLQATPVVSGGIE